MRFCRRGRAPNPDYAGTIPQQTFMVYQLMFAIITPALITGAYCGADEVQRHGCFHDRCGSDCVLPAWRTWCGARADC